jgi:hypothetical protein
MRIIVIEEVHRYCYEGLLKRYDLGEPIILKYMREIRKYGNSVLQVDQIPSLQPKQLPGNTNTFIVFRTPNPSCMKVVAESCNLYPEQKAKLAELAKRQAIVYSSELDKPYLIETLDFPLERVSDEFVRRKTILALELLPFVPLPEKKKVASDASEAGLDLGGRLKELLDLKKCRSWDDLFAFIRREECPSLSKIYEATGIDPRYCRKQIREMEKLGLVETVPLSLGRIGCPTTFVILKDDAAVYLETSPEKIRLPGKGSSAHRIAQSLITKKMRRLGENALVEHFMNGKSADVAVIGAKGTIAFEIETEPNEHVAENVRRDLQAGFARVVVISINRLYQNENIDIVSRYLDGTIKDRVEFRLLREFL